MTKSVSREEMNEEEQTGENGPVRSQNDKIVTVNHSKFHFALWFLFTVENWVLDFGGPFYSLWFSDSEWFSHSRPDVADYGHMVYNVLTAFILLQLLERSATPVHKALQHAMIIFFVMGASIHLVGDSVQHNLMNLGYKNHLTVKENPLMQSLQPPELVESFELLYFYDEYLGHEMWYIALFVAYVFIFYGDYTPYAGNSSTVTPVQKNSKYFSSENTSATQTECSRNGQLKNSKLLSNGTTKNSTSFTTSQSKNNTSIFESASKDLDDFLRKNNTIIPLSGWMLLFPSALFEWYLITEGQMVHNFLAMLTAMLSIAFYKWSQGGHYLGVNGRWLVYRSILVLILIGAWVCYLWDDHNLRKRYPHLLYVPEPWSYASLYMTAST